MSAEQEFDSNIASLKGAVFESNPFEFNSGAVKIGSRLRFYLRARETEQSETPRIADRVRIAIPQARKR
jgi:hypothetical protein